MLKKTIRTGLGFISESAEQLKETISPGKLVEQAVGVKQKADGEKKDEIAEYLRGLSDPNLTSEELERIRQQAREQDKKELARPRRLLERLITPTHMRLPPQKEQLRPYEQSWHDLEQKKAQQVEAQKKQSQTKIPPVGVSKQPFLPTKMAAIRRKTSMEGLKKDTKI